MDDDTEELIDPDQAVSFLHLRDKSDLSDGEGWDNETYDDLDYHNDAVDPIGDEVTDDSAEALGVPPEEFEAEMVKIALDEDRGQNDEDSRKTTDDRGEATDSPAPGA